MTDPTDHHRRRVLCGVALIASLPLLGQRPEAAQSPVASGVRATRLPQNPLITLKSSSTLGDNINGPSVIRVPSWIEHPLGRYYMYFAHHMGLHIRMAYADAITGPWHVYEPGVLRVENTAFYRPQPDPPENLENFYTHVASPEVFVDNANQRVVLWFHGWWTEGAMWPVGPAAAQAWARQHGYAQSTQSAESSDGLHFAVKPSITKTSYLRVFQRDGYLYGMARLGLLLRSRDPFGSFEVGQNVFRGGPYAGRVRHVAVLPEGSMLHVFFTGIGDAPERVMLSSVDMSGDWQTWKASEPIELLRPAAEYECTNLPNEPSDAGDIKGPAQQLRDPAIFQEDGKTYLFYSICGEQGIAAAELIWR
jgi:hypothetical protein